MVINVLIILKLETCEVAFKYLTYRKLDYVETFYILFLIGNVQLAMFSVSLTPLTIIASV